MDSRKQGQGFRKTTFVKNSAVNFEHNCQSCKYIPRLHVERQSIPLPKKGFRDIDFVNFNVSFFVLSINLKNDSVILPIMLKGFIAKKFENH